MFGHSGSFDAFGAALVNGTAAHGEDYDDTFEGGPVHSGAVIVPAVVAACEREGLGGDRLLVGIATGTELMCRMSLVAPMATPTLAAASAGASLIPSPTIIVGAWLFSAATASTF